MQQDSATTRSIEGKDGPAITVGLDVGDRYTHVHALGAGGEVLRERRVRTAAAALGAALTGLPPARVVLEAGPRSPWLSRVVADLGHEVVVANPRQVALIAGSQRKTDRLDAAWLARLGRFDPELLAPIRHRSEQSQHNLAVVRARDALVRSRDVAHQPRARGRQGLRRRAAVVHGRGLSPQDGGAHSRRAAPGAAAAGGGDWRADRAHRGGRAGGRGVVRGPPRDRGAAPGHRRGADHRAHVRADDRETRGASRRTGRWGPTSGSCRGSATQGSARRSSASARAADAGLRRLLVQAAHYILGPFGPDTDLRRWGERYAGTGAGNAKKRAVVAVARRLAVLLLALWKSGEVYEPLRHAVAREAA